MAHRGRERARPVRRAGVSGRAAPGRRRGSLRSGPGSWTAKSTRSKAARNGPSSTPGEDISHEDRVVAEGAAAPGAEHEAPVAEGLGHGEDVRHAPLEDRGELEPLLEAQLARARGGRGDHGREEGRLEELAPLVPEERHVGEVMSQSVSRSEPAARFAT